MLVIDANILFSALIKDSLTAERIFEEDLKLYTAEFIIEEFWKYEEAILKKTHRTKEEFIQIMHQLREVITVVPKEEYDGFMGRARAISPDEKDIAYFALAMKMACGIWSNDKKMKEQDSVKVFNSQEMIKLR